MTTPNPHPDDPAHDESGGGPRGRTGGGAEGGLTGQQALHTAAGPGYAREWALFCDYATATDQPSLPTTVDTLVGFLRALPTGPTTTARRIRAIAAAHRRTGHLLGRPETGPGAPPPTPPRPGAARTPR